MSNRNRCIQQYVPNPKGYRLDSDLRRFELVMFGYGLIKTVVEGAIVWTLPCNLATGIEENPRTEGEALMCYFLRLFEEGITVSEGAEGPQGPDSTTAGLAGWTEVSIALTAPTGSEMFVFTVEDPIEHIFAGQVLFIEGLGWALVSSIDGNDIVSAEVIQYVAEPWPIIPVGALVVPTGPAGPPGDEVLQVQTPIILPESGVFSGSLEVTITSATFGAEIHYTTDGSTATELSPTYSGAFTVTADTDVSAMAVKSGYLDSAEATAEYTLAPSAPDDLDDFTVLDSGAVATNIGSAVDGLPAMDTTDYSLFVLDYVPTNFRISCWVTEWTADPGAVGYSFEWSTDLISWTPSFEELNLEGASAELVTLAGTIAPGGSGVLYIRPTFVNTTGNDASGIINSLVFSFWEE